MGWLTPGLGVKRWIFVILVGTTLIGLGFAVLILDVYRTAPETWWLPVLSILSLRFLTRPLRALIFGGMGVADHGLGIWGLNRALLKPFMQPGRECPGYRFGLSETGPRAADCGDWRRNRAFYAAARVESAYPTT